MINKSYATKIFADYFDYLPIFSTISNLVIVYQKCITIPSMSQQNVKNSHYYSHIKDKSILRCVTVLFPLFGNIVIACYDIANHFNKCFQQQVVEKTPVPPEIEHNLLISNDHSKGLLKFNTTFKLVVKDKTAAESLIRYIEQNPWFKCKIAKVTDKNFSGVGPHFAFKIGYTPDEILTMISFFIDHPHVRDALFSKDWLSRPVFAYDHTGYSSKNGSVAIPKKLTLLEELAKVKVGEVKDAGELLIPEGNISEKLVVETMLQQFDGICLADTRHEMSEPKQFLIEMMPTLKEQGVTTIFLEHLFYETQQKTLDDYIQIQEATMPPDLKKYLSYLDLISKLSTGFAALVEEAKKLRIRIVAIDTGESYAHKSTTKTGSNNYSSRGPALNEQAYAIIKREVKNDEKYVVFCGGAHVINQEGVPGISQYLHIPNIFIEKSENNTPSIQVNLEKHPNDKYQLTGFVHALIHRV